jgi:RNA polymerase sigma factor for flagellar operon FliA
MRDKIVLTHLPLVKAIAIRVHENLPVHVDLDDLIHAGVLGLFDAVAKYDRTKNVEFQSYAKHRIKGAILDSLRQVDWASRDMRKRQKKIDAVNHELAGKLGRSPNETELAEGLGVSTERLRHFQTELVSLGLVSISNSDPDRDRPQEFAARDDWQPDRICEQRQLQSTLADALGSLPERYQKVVMLYYSNDMTMREIGEMLGVNESRISQIHKIALKKMAVVLQSRGIRSAGAL